MTDRGSIAQFFTNCKHFLKLSEKKRKKMHIFSKKKGEKERIVNKKTADHKKFIIFQKNAKSY